MQVVPVHLSELGGETYQCHSILHIFDSEFSLGIIFM